MESKRRYQVSKVPKSLNTLRRRQLLSFVAEFISTHSIQPVIVSSSSNAIVILNSFDYETIAIISVENWLTFNHGEWLDNLDVSFEQFIETFSVFNWELLFGK